MGWYFEGAEVEFLGRVGGRRQVDQRERRLGELAPDREIVAVTVSQPYLNMYRPGSVTRPALCHVTLLTTDSPSVPNSRYIISP